MPEATRLSRLLRHVEAEATAYRYAWKGSAASTFLTPTLYLLAMGVGLGTLVDDATAGGVGGGVRYVAFVAPGLLVASTMQVAASEATWPVMAGIKWRGTWAAVLATPLGVSDLVAGQIAWVAIRSLTTALAFAAVAAVLGALPIGPGLAAVGVAVLVGVATATPIVAYTASVRDAPALSKLFRFGLVPAFLFSGTFFPLSELPGWVQQVAVAVPLWHGVELARAIALDTPAAWPMAGHLGVLLAWSIVAAPVAVRQVRRRLTP